MYQKGKNLLVIFSSALLLSHTPRANNIVLFEDLAIASLAENYFHLPIKRFWNFLCKFTTSYRSRRIDFLYSTRFPFMLTYT